MKQVADEQNFVQNERYDVLIIIIIIITILIIIIIIIIIMIRCNGIRDKVMHFKISHVYSYIHLLCVSKSFLLLISSSLRCDPRARPLITNLVISECFSGGINIYHSRKSNFSTSYMIKLHLL